MIRIYSKILAEIFDDKKISDSKIKEYYGLFIKKKYTRNQLLVSEGELWDKVFYIHKGILRLFYIDIKGREFNKGFYWEEQLAWPIAPCAQKYPSLFYIATIEETELQVCPFNVFRTWLLNNGVWEKFALKQIEEFIEHKFGREHQFLVNSATERFEKFCLEYPDLIKRIPDYHLASYLGISNVSLSRIKNLSNH